METQISPSKIGFQYGIIAGIFLVLYGLILQLTGLAANQALGYVSFVILAVIIYMAHNAFKNQGDGFMRFGQGVKIGFFVSLIGGIISSIFTYIYVSYVDDFIIREAVNKAYQDMEQKGLSDEEINNAMSFMEKFMTPVFFMIIGLFLTIIFGLIISLIVSAITKKDNPQPAV